MFTFQTVKLSLETWLIIDELSKRENLSMSESLERLVRHGHIHYRETTQRLEA
jgi:hypothetical protein